MSKYLVLALLGVSLNSVGGLPLQTLMAERQRLAALAQAEQEFENQMNSYVQESSSSSSEPNQLAEASAPESES